VFNIDENQRPEVALMLNIFLTSLVEKVIEK